MGLLELCLVSLLTPQEPAPTAKPDAVSIPSVVGSNAPAADVAQGNEDERNMMRDAERAGAKADPSVLAQLASSPNEKVAARAAFLLGRVDGEAAVAALGEVVTATPHVSARLQAMNALLRRADVGSTQAAIRALDDADASVRTLAAQLLGKLRRPAAVDPLLALLERPREEPTADPRNANQKATDIQAALLALHDLGAKDQLLRAANALQQHPANGAGESLSFCFQNLSPKLEPKQEVTVLVAVLAHREPLLRRYAIGRLGTLADPTTATALEGRLASESAELRPLVEVALSQVRSDPSDPMNDNLHKFIANAKSLAAQARTRWDTLPVPGRWLVAGVPVSVLLLFVLMARRRRRRADRAAADATMALVAPSDEHVQELAEEAEALEAAVAAEAHAGKGRAAKGAAAPRKNELVRR